MPFPLLLIWEFYRLIPKLMSYKRVVAGIYAFWWSVMSVRVCNPLFFLVLKIMNLSKYWPFKETDYLNDSCKVEKPFVYHTKWCLWLICSFSDASFFISVQILSPYLFLSFSLSNSECSNWSLQEVWCASNLL